MPNRHIGLETNITLSIKELLTYSFFVITFGASIYTFFKAIPKIETLSVETSKMNTAIAVSEVKIESISKQIDDLKKDDQKAK